MAEGDAVRLALEIDRDDEPISGRLCRVGDADAVWPRGDEDVFWHFTGWVELTRALEEACEQ